MRLTIKIRRGKALGRAILALWATSVFLIVWFAVAYSYPPETPQEPPRATIPVSHEGEFAQCGQEGVMCWNVHTSMLETGGVEILGMRMEYDKYPSMKTHDHIRCAVCVRYQSTMALYTLGIVL